MNVYLVEPTVDLQEEYLEFYQEWKNSGETMIPWVIEKDPSNFRNMVQELLDAAEGKNLLEIAAMRETSPADAVFDLLLEENAGVTMVISWGEEVDITNALAHPMQIVGSDGIFGGKPHPRLYGTFPRILGRFVRDQEILTMSEAIRHMTGAPAQLLRLKDRGYIAEGYWADIVIFDPNTVADLATYEEPLLEPTGIHYVLVNGEIAVNNSLFTGRTAGKVIRREEISLKIT